jgi:hypothetical protein
MSLDRQRIDAVKLLEKLGYSYTTEFGWGAPLSGIGIKAELRNEEAADLLRQLGYHHDSTSGWHKPPNDLDQLIIGGAKLSQLMATLPPMSVVKLPPYQMFCNKCGSTNVVSDALATWAVDLQRWELADVLDETTCNECGASGWHDIKDAPAGDFADCQECSETYHRNHLTNGECKDCIDAKGATP